MKMKRLFLTGALLLVLVFTIFEISGVLSTPPALNLSQPGLVGTTQVGAATVASPAKQSGVRDIVAIPNSDVDIGVASVAMVTTPTSKNANTLPFYVIAASAVLSIAVVSWRKYILQFNNRLSTWLNTRLSRSGVFAIGADRCI